MVPGLQVCVMVNSASTCTLILALRITYSYKNHVSSQSTAITPRSPNTPIPAIMGTCVPMAKALVLVPLRFVAVSVENGLAVVIVVFFALDTPLLLEPCTLSISAAGN